MPQAVIAEIGSRPQVVGTKSLPAIGDVIATRRSLHGYRAVIDIAVIIVVVGTTVVAVTLRSQGSTDNGASDRAGEKSAAVMVVIISAAAMSVAAAISRPGRSAEMDATAASTETGGTSGIPSRPTS